MNKLHNIVLASALLGALTPFAAVQATEHQQGSYLEEVGDKATRGFANLATGFIELPKNVVNISHDSNIAVGMTWGVLRGAAHTVGRTLLGAGEFITSPIPTGTLISPSWVFDRFSEDTRYFGYALPLTWTTFGPFDDGDID